ncbi:unnamed protein product [Adineta steineri]|uniref:Fibronectin type-III domain-containing protein n=1 Tax=Adineta steineri TaxID=433720 RepID=A0A814KZU7_9BILA|nr:unnamed protein product [Adineta steineri]CAF0974369.1 unnamed protein product [Adineta steineri]CAF1058332.1 unnamed protein product [Adineta steineri]
MAIQQTITMPTLGRPFHLGMLYDVRNDELISGITLWNPQTLANHTITYKQPYTGYEILTGDSLQDKAHALGVEASLKLSLFGGLMNISGSAKYAEDYQKTNREARLILKYSTTTHFQELTMKHLGKSNLDLHDKNNATHVVIGVLYGAEAFFIFDRTISNRESKEEVSGSLKAIFDKTMFKIEEEAKLNLTKQEKKYVHKLRCKFYGDFRLNKNPKNFEEAVKMYRQLPLRIGKNNENAIPKKVWLYPLHLLDNNVTRTVREISSNLVHYSISTIENLRSLEVRALDLSESSIFTSLNHMKKQLLHFTARLSKMQHDLKENIALNLPKLRGNTDVEEPVLYNVFKQIDSSPFNQQKLESWLKGKKKEIALITKWVNNLAKDRSLNTLVRSSSLDEVIGDTRYDYIFCLSLRLVEKNDSQLADMQNYLHNNSFNSSTTRKKHITWFEHRYNMTKFLKNLEQFKEFAEANNVENTKIKFIVNEEYSVNDTKTIELILYERGSEKKDFIIPSKPDAPYAISVTDNNVTLTWTDAANGTEEVQKYKVMYQQHRGEALVGKNKSKKEEKWTEVYTNASHKEIIIVNLPPNATFVFKVQSITAIGLSAISACSKPIETLAKKDEQSFIETSTTQDSCNTFVPIPSAAKCTAPEWRANGVTVTSSLDAPVNLFIDRRDRMWVVDQGHHRVQRFVPGSSNGTTVAEGSAVVDKSAQLLWAWGFYVDANDNVYVADFHGRVQKFAPGDLDGATIAGGRGNGTELYQFGYSYSIFFDRQDQLYVSDSTNCRVIKFASGSKVGSVVISASEVSQPTGIYVDGCNNLYVADEGKHVVRKYLNGNLTLGTTIMGEAGKGGPGSHQLNIPRGLAFDRYGNVYVADESNHRVQRLSIRDGTVRTVAGVTGVAGIGSQHFNRPSAVGFDSKNNLFVVDIENNRVQKFEFLSGDLWC